MPPEYEIRTISIQRLLQHYNLGNVETIRNPRHGESPGACHLTLCAFDGTRRDYVLTLLAEIANPKAFMEPLVHRAHQAGLAVAPFLADQLGQTVHALEGQQAMLAEHLPGTHSTQPDGPQCGAMGRLLGRFHKVTRHIQPGPGFRTPPSCGREERERLIAGLSWNDQRLLQDVHRSAAALCKRGDASALPAGPVHGAPRRENVLFADGRLTGLQNFQYARRDVFLADLADALVDWCHTPEGHFRQDLAERLIAGYHSTRALDQRELWFLTPFMLRAAIRRWLESLRQANDDLDPSIADRGAELRLRPEAAGALVQTLWTHPPDIKLRPARRYD